MSDVMSIARLLHDHNRGVPADALIEQLSLLLRRGGIADPRRTATDILAALLDVPRSWPTMHREALITPAVIDASCAAAARISRGAPFCYAVGTAAFRHLTLAVDERVLIPRPETELLVQEILDRFQVARGCGSGWGTAIDIGTGSGGIALALASEGNFDRVIATDASRDALSVAAANLERAQALINATVEFRQGSLLAPVAGISASVVVSNPPYIAYSEAVDLPLSVRDHEPPFALFSGREGMSATAGIVRDAASVLEPGGVLALEVDERRASLVAELVMAHGAYSDVGVKLDLVGRERFVFASRP